MTLDPRDALRLALAPRSIAVIGASDNAHKIGGRPLAYLARFAFASELAFYVVLAMAAAIGGAVYWIAMESAASTALMRREAILQELSKGDGPVASD